MTKTPMTHKRFKDIIACYGADESCWPANEADAMNRLLVISPDLQKQVIKAKALDHLLNLTNEPETIKVSDDLMDRLMAVPNHHNQRKKAQHHNAQHHNRDAFNGLLGLLMTVFQVQTRGDLFPRFAGLATAAILGIFVGTLNLTGGGQGVHIIDASQLMMGDPGLIRDLTELN